MPPVLVILVQFGDTELRKTLPINSLNLTLLYGISIPCPFALVDKGDKVEAVNCHVVVLLPIVIAWFGIIVPILICGVNIVPPTELWKLSI